MIRFANEQRMNIVPHSRATIDPFLVIACATKLGALIDETIFCVETFIYFYNNILAIFTGSLF